MSSSATTLAFPENVPGIRLLREEGEWKYIDLSDGVDEAALRSLLEGMPQDREMCFFEYQLGNRLGDTNGLYVMLQVHDGACYYWKGNHGRTSELERMDFAESVAMIAKNIVQEDAFLYLVPVARRFELRPDFRWHKAPERAPDGAGELVRHLLATLAFRFQRATSHEMEDAAVVGFGDFVAGSGVRTPAEIVRHMRSVLAFTAAELTGEPRPKINELPWIEEIAAFHAILQRLDGCFLADSHPERLLKRLLQGPITDAFTHVGQLAMLRRMYGHPVPGMNFFSAEIRTGKVN